MPCGDCKQHGVSCLQAWMDARLDGSGRVQLSGDSDSALTRGLVAVLLRGLSGLTPEEVLAVEPASLAGLVSVAFSAAAKRLRCYRLLSYHIVAAACKGPCGCGSPMRSCCCLL